MMAWKNRVRALVPILKRTGAAAAPTGTAVFDYDVGLFDEEDWLVAIGRMTLAFTPAGESKGQDCIDGGHCFDRRGASAPRLPLGAPVAGLTNGGEMRMSLMGFLSESLRIEARFIDAERKRWEGLWFEPAFCRFPSGNVRASAVAGPRPAQSIPGPWDA